MCVGFETDALQNTFSEGFPTAWEDTLDDALHQGMIMLCGSQLTGDWLVCISILCGLQLTGVWHVCSDYVAWLAACLRVVHLPLIMPCEVFDVNLACTLWRLLAGLTTNCFLCGCWLDDLTRWRLAYLAICGLLSFQVLTS